jgi:3-deoxy-7-phosphoheptulonate synthase
VGPISKAAVACGADGLIIEVHNEPENALSDGHQSLYPAQFEELMTQLQKFIEAAGKQLILPFEALNNENKIPIETIN